MIRRKESEPRVVVDQVVAHQLIKRDSVAAPAATFAAKPKA
jgi:LacI family transcriptional regulator